MLVWNVPTGQGEGSPVIHFAQKEMTRHIYILISWSVAEGLTAQKLGRSRRKKMGGWEMTSQESISDYRYLLAFPCGHTVLSKQVAMCRLGGIMTIHLILSSPEAAQSCCLGV